MHPPAHRTHRRGLVLGAHPQVPSDPYPLSGIARGDHALLRRHAVRRVVRIEPARDHVVGVALRGNLQHAVHPQRRESIPGPLAVQEAEHGRARNRDVGRLRHVTGGGTAGHVDYLRLGGAPGRGQRPPARHEGEGQRDGQRSSHPSNIATPRRRLERAYAVPAGEAISTRFPSGSRTYATSWPHGFVCGGVTGRAPSVTARSKAPWTSSVTKQTSNVGWGPERRSGLYRPGTFAAASSCAANASAVAPVSSSAYCPLSWTKLRRCPSARS